MDWVVFGDDWGAHVSTTQHLVRNLPESDSVVWVNSLGMRAPRLAYEDLVRLKSKATAILRSSSGGAERTRASAGSARANMAIVNPKIVPWHLSPVARRYNARAIAKEVTRAMEQLEIVDPFVLSATPVCVDYLDFHARAVAYLKLDEYREMSEVDASLIDATEPRMVKRVDLVLATAKTLLPDCGADTSKCVYLPHGVDFEHFAQVSTHGQGTKTVGFYGLIDDRLDYDLVEAVALLATDWTFEFIGALRVPEHRVFNLPNVKLAGSVPYAELPYRIEHWTAAWIPYELNKHTQAINPLKLREYLAAGLPVLSTPLPESSALEDVSIITNCHEARDAIEEFHRSDTPSRREARREKMKKHSWGHRANRLRRLLSDKGTAPP